MVRYPCTYGLRKRGLTYRASVRENDALILAVVEFNSQIDSLHVVGRAGDDVSAADIAIVARDLHARSDALGTLMSLQPSREYQHDTEQRADTSTRDFCRVNIRDKALAGIAAHGS